MARAVHGIRWITLTLLCLLLLVSGALPQAARAQDGSDPAAGDPIPSTSRQTDGETPYTIESIPGGGTVGDFVVGPGKLELEIAPGESKVVEMTVTNRTGERRIFNLQTEDTRGSRSTEQTVVLLGDDRGPYSLKDYLEFEAARFELDHNERARIPVTVSVPPDAEPGGLYGSVLVNTIALEAEAGDTLGTTPQSAVVARIGTLFFIRVPGEVAYDASLVDFATIPERSFFANGPITFGLTFENNSSVHVTPQGEIEIVNMFGEAVGYAPLDPWFVMPDSLRLREVVWNREFLFGRYTATVWVDRGYDNIVDTMEYSFWVLPWKLLLLAFAVIFVAVFLIRTFFTRFEFRRRDNE